MIKKTSDIRYIILICYIITSFFCSAQTVSISILGSVVDSTRNDVLRNASISLFNLNKNKLDQVTLTDNFGQFNLKINSKDSIYRLDITHTGYEIKRINFNSKKVKSEDFKSISLKIKSNKLDTIDLSPVRMNRDTIEFIADYFSLDSNAVIEDLLYKLPGLIIWGDGKITYKNKIVPKVLVNGQEFFGSDKGIALKNIPKSSVDKIQLYETTQRYEMENNSSSYEMNVQLKKGKEKMLFGNIAMGYSFNKYLDVSSSLNYRDDLNQVSLIYAKNNINKNLSSIDQLLSNSAYKGVGISADYNPNFFKSGLSSEDVIGARYYRNFNSLSKKSTKYLTTSFLSKWSNEFNVDSSSINYVSQALNNNYSNRKTQNDRRGYENQMNSSFINYFDWNNRPTSITALLSTNVSDFKSLNNSEVEFEFSNNHSKNNLLSQSDNKKTHVYSKVGIDIEPKLNHYNFLNKIKINTFLEVSLKNSKSLLNRSNDYINFIDNLESKQFNRLYSSTQKGYNATANLRLTYDNISIFQQTSITNEKSDYHVDDLNEGVYSVNYLTREEELIRYNLEQGLSYNKLLFSKKRLGRFKKHLNLYANVVNRIYVNDNQSTFISRNIKQNFIGLIASSGLSYNYEKISKYNFTSNINTNYNEVYPEIDQLSPIYDDINPSSKQIGNLNLRQSNKYVFNWKTTLQPSNSHGVNFTFDIKKEYFNHEIIDSIVYAENQTEYYNINSYKRGENFSINFIQKAAKIFKNRDNINYEFSLRFSNRLKYQYINIDLYKLNQNTYSGTFNIYYTKIDKLQLGVKNTVNLYASRRLIENEDYTEKFTNLNWNSTFVIAYGITKNWQINNNVTNKLFKYSTIDNLFIWNVNSTYRIGKQKNYEVKMSIYDILNQNKGIYISNNIESTTIGYKNTLNRFFMLSIAYFPRYF